MAAKDDMPIGTKVRVVYYGYGARAADCGRTAVVVAHNRKRVVVRWDTREWGAEPTAAIDPGCLLPVVPIHH